MRAENTMDFFKMSGETTAYVVIITITIIIIIFYLYFYFYFYYYFYYNKKYGITLS